jgi:hypothetical protein
MRTWFLWLGFAATVTMALVWGDDSEAQPGKQGPFGFGKKGTVTADQIVERVLSFDKNSDGKLTAEELPERMQHLIALGDVNKDGALDREEIRKLATTLESFLGLAGPDGPAPGFGPKGFGKGGFKGPFKGPVGEVQRTLDDLNVTGPARDKADRVLRAQQEKLRRFEELIRAELLVQMKELLSDEDYRLLTTAVDRPNGPPGFKGPRPSDLNVNARVEQLQKELDELRRKLAK